MTDHKGFSTADEAIWLRVVEVGASTGFAANAVTFADGILKSLVARRLGLEGSSLTKTTAQWLEAVAEAEAWNDAIKVGDKVVHKDSAEGKIYTTKSMATVCDGGAWVELKDVMNPQHVFFLKAVSK